MLYVDFLDCGGDTVTFEHYRGLSQQAWFAAPRNCHFAW